MLVKSLLKSQVLLQALEEAKVEVQTQDHLASKVHQPLMKMRTKSYLIETSMNGTGTPMLFRNQNSRTLIKTTQLILKKLKLIINMLKSKNTLKENVTREMKKQK
jgi:hypothetical protein